MVLEDMLQLFGYPIVVAGLFQWHALNRRWQEQLQQQVVTDYLTGVLNRRGFMDIFEQEVTRSRRYNSPLSLIWFDLDRFKQVNDRYGHHVGDEVLHATARQTEDLLRQVDIFARMGGEEFCILLPETALPGALDVAEKLRQAFEQCDCSGEVGITASFGVGEYRPGEDGEQLLKRVDNALYRAKDEGRNRVVSE
jgi:diguanylate cyclase (GGDEF)-like protein